jgi:hypothetical protein
VNSLVDSDAWRSGAPLAKARCDRALGGDELFSPAAFRHRDMQSVQGPKTHTLRSNGDDPLADFWQLVA